MLRTYPDRSVFSRMQLPYRIISKTGTIAGYIAEYFKAVAVKTVQTVLGADPDKPFFVLDNAGGGIVR